MTPDARLAIGHASDAAAIGLGGVITFALRHGTVLLPGHYWGLIVVGILAHRLSDGLFPSSSSRSERSLLAGEAVLQVMRLMVMALTLVTLAFLIKISDQFSRLWVGGWLGLSLVLIVVQRWQIARHLRISPAVNRRLLIVDDDAWPARIDGSRIIPLADIHAILRMPPDSAVEIVVPAAIADLPDGASLLRQLRRLPNRVLVSLGPALHGLPISNPGNVGGRPCVELFAPPLSAKQRFSKRVCDLISVAALLPVALPIMAVIALCIRGQGRGPIIFRQPRAGRHGQPFTMLKFRTMRPEASSDPAAPPAVPADPRVTPLGAVLRRYHLDELPQLFNVLAGDMSLVGPRPHAVPHDDAYAELIEDYSHRRRVKPGITGWAQVNGYHGWPDSLDSIRLRAQFDIDYIENWSLAFDAHILLLTLIGRIG